MSKSIPGLHRQFCLVLLVVALGACASPGDRPYSPDTERSIRERVEKALPQWDERVLRAQERNNWAAGLDYEYLFRAMNDTPVAFERVPPDAVRYSDGTKAVRLEAKKGKLRYVNQTRAWSFERLRDTKAVPPERARAAAMETLGRVKLPADEFGEAQINTQIAAGAPVGERQTRDRFEMYRVVEIPRQINELPVYGSHARVVVANDESIHRLQIAWPAFRLAPSLSLKERRAVIEETVQQILRQGPTGDAEIRAQLAYAAQDQEDDAVRFVPAVIVSVLAPPTPYQLVVPVAEIKRSPLNLAP